MRGFLLRASAFLGLHLLFRFFRRNALTILLYHGVSPAISQGIFNYRKKFIDPLVFARQMEYLRRKYTILPLEEALERLAEGTLPPHALSVTFDDGYQNNYTYAFPVLRAHSIPATIYLSTDFVDRRTPLWVDRLEHAIGMSPHGLESPIEEKIAADIALRSKLKAYGAEKREAKLRDLEAAAGISLTSFVGVSAAYAPLTWEECRMMRQWRIAFGAHTVTHPILSRLSREAQRAEIDESRAVISEKLGVVSKFFAYPNGQPGDWTEETAEILEKSGFAGALTTVPGKNTRRTDPYALRRISMDATEDWTIFLLTTSGVMGWFSSMKRLFVR